MKKLIILMVLCASCTATKIHKPQPQYRITPVYKSGKSGESIIIKD